LDSISLRPRGIGEILDGALRLYREDLGLYVLTALGASLPSSIGMVLTVGGTEFPVLAGVGVLAVLGGMFAYLVMWAALMYQMNDRLEGRAPSLGSSLDRSVRRVFTVLWAVILVYATLFLVMMGVGMGSVLLGAVGALIGGDVLGVVLAVVVGAALTFTVGVRAFAGSMIFLPGVVAEGLTGFGSVKRGFGLTKKGSFRVTTILSIASFLIFIPVMAVYFVTGTINTVMDPNALENGTVTMTQLALQQLLLLVSSGFTTPFLVACVLLTYYDQRVRLEAFDLEAEVGTLVD